ncbi:MAG TPA: glycosyltransferase [Mycobacteriales bacterium]|nr:glycosyltransferase [Mycobacteriales bacterium]
MTDQRPVVVLSPERWRAVPTNKHQVARGISAVRPVLYVDLVGVSTRDLWRERWWLVPRMVQPNLWVIRPLVFPKRVRVRSRLALVASAVLSNWHVRWALRTKLRWLTPALICYFPTVIHGLERLRPGAVIYHCVDHHSSFPDWAPRAGDLLAAEAKLVRRADAVLATSPQLAVHCRQWREDVRMVGNPADVDAFAVPPKPCATLRDGLSVFFHGTYSAHKIDFAFLRRLTDCALVRSVTLVGPLGHPSDRLATAALGELEADPKVVRIGSTPQADISALLGDVDVLALPYLVSEHTRHVLPLKLGEYLATGMPIVSTPLPAVVEVAGDAVYYCSADAEIVAALRAACSESPALRQRRIALAQERTWEKRVRELLDVIDAVG